MAATEEAPTGGGAQHSKETFHLINAPGDAIHEALTGLTQHHPSLSYAPTHKIVYRSDLADFRRDHVTTIGFSGGGHEPMFGGFVGPSFLSAYVSGNIFASPTSAQILEAIKLCQPLDDPESHRHPGTLVVCGNYTGDILNAGLAITRAQALGYKVAFVPVGDDVAVGRRKGGKMIDLITNTSDEDRAFVPFTGGATAENPQRVVLALNSLGSTSDAVLAAFAELAKEELARKNYVVERVLLGPLVTSLKMSGVGITVWRLPGDTEKSPLERGEALELWDGNVDVVAWRQ
ncbi:hypothetical protein SLS55_003170 [Diplodia seriata]|uniref:DhaK domain-containing protein n=1 Tax=Diplodia seriata TaxID=420778 RepID=A0ABR3CMA2_9PEZI